MKSRKVKMFLHDDVMYQILLRLHVVSLLRFKLVCRSWRALIESSCFIKKHLNLHHYDPNLKDKNHNLIYLLPCEDSPITFAVTSIESLEESNVCLQLNCSEIGRCFPDEVSEIVSYNGLLCLNHFNSKREQSICLWNPATKQSRALPRLSFPNMSEPTVGFGFDVKSNDYKVVNVIRNSYTNEMRVEVYSLNTSSWRSVTTPFPFIIFHGHPGMPFNDGTYFFWYGYNSAGIKEISCFDFSSEIFRSISFPHVDRDQFLRHISVVHDKIACAFGSNDHKIELWVFNEFGRVNESWAKLYTVDPYSKIDKGLCFVYLSTNGNYIFFKRMEQMCRFNVATEEINMYTLEKAQAFFKNCPRNSQYIYWFFNDALVEFKESLVSVGEGISAPTGVDMDIGKKKQETITN